MKLKYFILPLLLIIATTYVSKAENRIIIDKPNCMLYVVNENNDTIFQVPCCPGKNLGDKKVRGDRKTPEGNFKIQTMERAAHWVDSKGRVTGDYGPWFMRIEMPDWNSIGIHGTNSPESVGTRDSWGCIRLHNDDLEVLYKLVGIGTPVTILPD